MKLICVKCVYFMRIMRIISWTFKSLIIFELKQEKKRTVRRPLSSQVDAWNYLFVFYVCLIFHCENATCALNLTKFDCFIHFFFASFVLFSLTEFIHHIVVHITSSMDWISAALCIGHNHFALVFVCEHCFFFFCFFISSFFFLFSLASKAWTEHWFSYHFIENFFVCLYFVTNSQFDIGGCLCLLFISFNFPLYLKVHKYRIAFGVFMPSFWSSNYTYTIYIQNTTFSMF